MKKINKLLFTILFVLVAFVSVKAAEIKTIDTSIYLLPRDGMTTDEVFVPFEYSYKTARVTNTDKVVVTYVEAYDKNGDYMWFSDVFEAGETYKIVLALGTASINDYISKTATVTLKTVGGNYTLTKEYLDSVNYTYSFEYTVPTEPLEAKELTFYLDGTDSSTGTMLVNNGTEIEIPETFYNNAENKLKKFVGYEVDGTTYAPGAKYTVTKDATLVAKFEDAETVKIAYYLDGNKVLEDDAIKGEELWRYQWPIELYELVPDGKEMEYQWYLDPEYKKPVVYLDDDLEYIYITGNMTLYTRLGWSYSVDGVCADCFVDGFGTVYSVDDDYESEHISGFLPTGTTTTTLRAKPGKNFHFVGWKANYSDTEYLSTSTEYKLTLTQNNTDIYAEFAKDEGFFEVNFGGYSFTTVKSGEKITAPTNIHRLGEDVEGWYTDYEGLHPYDFNTPVTEDLELYPQWKKSSKILFPVYYYDDYKQYKIDYVEEGTKATAPASPTKSGKTFKGWYGWGDAESSMYEKFDYNTPIYVGHELHTNYTDKPAELTAAKISVSKVDNNVVKVVINNYIDSQKYTLETSTNGKKWTKVKVNEENGVFIVKGLTYGKKTYYRVKAELNGKKNYSNKVNITVKPNKVKNLKAESVGTNNVKLSWDKVGVTGYEVYNGKKKVATITKSKTVTYNQKKLKANKKYTYKVRAYKKVGSKKVYGPWSDTLTVVTAPDKPKLSLSIKEYNEMNLKIGSVKGATTYVVEKSLDGKTYTLVEELPGAGNLAQGELEIGKTYYFRLKACNASGSCSKWAVASKKQTTKVPAFALSTSSKTVTVSVTAVQEAEGYEVARSTSKKGKYKTVATITGEELTFLNKTKKGTKYYYKVRSYKTVNGKKVYSDYAKVKNIKSK